MSGLINLAYKTSAGTTKLDEVNYSSASDEFKEVILKASNGGNETYAYTTNDSTYEEVTSIHIKKDGQEYRVISKYILPIPKYEKVTFDKAGTYTWTCPKGITKVRVTLAGAGGGLWEEVDIGGGSMRENGGDGELVSGVVTSTGGTLYPITIGEGGRAYYVNETDDEYYEPTDEETEMAQNNELRDSTAFNLLAHGGGYSTFNMTSYKGGGKGSSSYNKAQDGWCIIEYGTDIQGTSTSSSPKPGFGYDTGKPNIDPDYDNPEPDIPDIPEPDNPTPDDK